MENDTPKSERMRFYEVCQMYNFDYKAMQALADKARVPKEIVDRMAVSAAVRRAQATSVLAALSDLTSQTWNFDNVKVALLPTFQNLHTVYQFDLAILSTKSGVSFDIISNMLLDEPVTKEEARLILLAASKQSGQNYTISNVDVKLAKEK